MIKDIEKIRIENDRLKELGKDKNLDNKGFVVPESCRSCRFMRGSTNPVCCYNAPNRDHSFPGIFHSDWCGKYEYDKVLR